MMLLKDEMSKELLHGTFLFLRPCRVNSVALGFMAFFFPGFLRVWRMFGAHWALLLVLSSRPQRATSFFPPYSDLPLNIPTTT